MANRVLRGEVTTSPAVLKVREKLGRAHQRNPIGVYVVVDNLPKAKLTDFYGAGAYPSAHPTNGTGVWVKTAMVYGYMAYRATPLAAPARQQRLRGADQRRSEISRE